MLSKFHGIRLFIILFFFLSGPLKSGAQDISPEIDSIIRVSQDEIYEYHYDASRIPLEELRRINQHINNNRLLYYITLLQAQLELADKNYGRASELYDSLFTISSLVGDSELIASSLINRGGFYESVNDFSTALAINLQAIDYAKGINDISKLGLLYNKIGLIYYQEKDYHQAMQYFFQSLVYYVRLRHTKIEKYWIQNTLGNLGLCHEKLGDYKKAIFYFNQAIANCYYNSEPERSKAVNIANLGQVYEKMGRFQEAIKLYKQSVAITTNPANHELFHGTNTLLRISSALLKTNNIEEARSYLDQAKTLIDKNGYRELLKDFYLLSSILSEKSGQPQKALDYYKNGKLLEDSLDDAAKNKNLSRLIMTHELNKKQFQNESLTKDSQIKSLRNRLLLVGLLLISLILVVLVLFIIELKRNNRILQQLNEANVEQKNNLERLNEDLRALNTHKNYILSTVAHDLRSPIGNVKAICDLLLKYDSDFNDEDKELVSLMGLSSQHALAIMEDIIDAAEMDRKVLSLNKTNCAIDEIIVQAINTTKYKSEGKGLKVHTNFTGDLHCMVDKDRLIRAFQNILTNSIKFSHNNGNIYIDASRETGKIRISFKDEGIGMSDDVKSRIFDAFTTAGRTGTEGEKSVGLGLSIVKRILKMHGGNIEVDTAPNKGSTFHIILPAS